MLSKELGDRMKEYEGRETERRFLPYIPVYARLDGKGFSKFTKNMVRPFDSSMHAAMQETTRYLIKETHALIGYTQSDEISLVWATTSPKEQLMFNGKVEKYCSILAGLATAAFMRESLKYWPELTLKSLPSFDCRVFQLPNRVEAANAFLWRELDATKNAISMATRTLYSTREMYKKSGPEMQEMLFQKGINFNDYPACFKRGSFLRRVNKYVSPEEMLHVPVDHRPTEPVIRSVIERLDMPKFSTVKNREAVIFAQADPEVA